MSKHKAGIKIWPRPRKLRFRDYLDGTIKFSKLEALALLCAGKVVESQKYDDMIIICTLHSIT